MSGTPASPTPNAGFRLRFEKTLLVCAHNCEAVEGRLVAAGCTVTTVRDGDSAVNRIHRERFDVAVLVSTGQEMDVVETALNLIDIRSAMPIVIVSGPTEGSQSAIQKITSTVSNTMEVSLDGLDALLGLPGRETDNRRDGPSRP